MIQIPHFFMEMLQRLRNRVILTVTGDKHMGYEAELNFKDYKIEFEYSYDSSDEGVGIDSWKAYDANDNQVEITDRQESRDIESAIEAWLENDWFHNGHNYEQDHLDYRADMAYESMRDGE